MYLKCLLLATTLDSFLTLHEIAPPCPLLLLCGPTLNSSSLLFIFLPTLVKPPKEGGVISLHLQAPQSQLRPMPTAPIE